MIHPQVVSILSKLENARSIQLFFNGNKEGYKVDPVYSQPCGELNNEVLVLVWKNGMGVTDTVEFIELDLIQAEVNVNNITIREVFTLSLS